MNKITNALLVLLALLFFSCNRNNGSPEQKETVNPIDPPITLVIDFVNENGGKSAVSRYRWELGGEIYYSYAKFS